MSNRVRQSRNGTLQRSPEAVCMKQSDAFRPHRFRWDAQSARRFWDAEASRRGRSDSYFSARVGEAVLRLVDRQVGLRGRVLDYGCGPGHLSERLVARGLDCTAVDFSEQSLACLKSRLGTNLPTHRAILAATLPLPLPSSAFDIVFFLETLEHLTPDALNPTLRELKRITAVGGWVVATTPNDEDLAASEVLCPECGAIFHRVQHLTSWTHESIRAAFMGAGFSECRTMALDFRRPSAFNRLRDLKKRLRRERPWHLACLARKGER
jgi:SAM-dependent methyltransferase